MRGYKQKKGESERACGGRDEKAYTHADSE